MTSSPAAPSGALLRAAPHPSPATALVTGGARRIGRAIAWDLGTSGWRVGVHYHASQNQAQALVAALREAGGNAVAVGADLSREEDVATLLARTEDALGPVGLVVNNASVFERDLLGTATRASWDRHLETNLRAPFLLTQALAATLPEGQYGNVINLIDQRVFNLTHDFMSYTLSKAGLWTLTQTAALALAPRLRVNGIGPGPTLPSPRQDPEHFRQQCDAMPLGRGAAPEEIVAAVRFLLTTPSMTGQMLALDGGQHLCWAPPATGRVVPE